MLWPRRAKVTPGALPEQTRRKYEEKTRKSTGRSKLESSRNVPDAHHGSINQNPDHIEPVRFGWAAMAVYPHHGRPGKLTLFPPAYRCHRATEAVATPRLNLNEGNSPVPLRHEIDVPVAVLEAPLDDPPALPAQPALSYPLPDFAEPLPRL